MDEGIEIIFGALAGVHFDDVVIAGEALSDAIFEFLISDSYRQRGFGFGLAFDVSHGYK